MKRKCWIKKEEMVDQQVVPIEVQNIIQMLKQEVDTLKNQKNIQMMIIIR